MVNCALSSGTNPNIIGGKDQKHRKIEDGVLMGVIAKFYKRPLRALI